MVFVRVKEIIIVIGLEFYECFFHGCEIGSSRVRVVSDDCRRRHEVMIVCCDHMAENALRNKEDWRYCGYF